MVLAGHGYSFCFFFFNDTATTEIYTLSLHDALPISVKHKNVHVVGDSTIGLPVPKSDGRVARSEEHTSELQSLAYLVCRLLLEKKKRSRTSSSSHCLCSALVPYAMYSALGA